MTPPTVDLWSAVLSAVEGSRLLLKSKGLGDEPTRRRLLDAFAARGIGPGRLLLAGPERKTADHLSRYAAVDVALDPYPYHGTTTTCEALWMGVPVVSLCGPSHVSRVGPSLLSAAGLSELAASTTQAYAEVAATLAADRPRLADLRATMRPRVLRSPLSAGEAYATKIEATYRALWARWCNAVP